MRSSFFGGELHQVKPAQTAYATIAVESLLGQESHSEGLGPKSNQ